MRPRTWMAAVKHAPHAWAAMTREG